MTSECPTYTANMCKVQDPGYSQVETSPHKDAVQNPEYVSSAISTKDETQSHVYAQIGPSLQGVIQASRNPAYGLFMIESSTQDGIVQLSPNPAYSQVEKQDDASVYEVVD